MVPQIYSTNLIHVLVHSLRYLLLSLILQRLSCIAVIVLVLSLEEIISGIQVDILLDQSYLRSLMHIPFTLLSIDSFFYF